MRLMPLGYGAVVTTESEEDLVEDLWLGSDKRGCYTRLDSPAMAMLAAAGEETHDLPTIPGQEEPKKGPLLYYDFVEFFGGSGRVSGVYGPAWSLCCPLPGPVRLSAL